MAAVELLDKAIALVDGLLAGAKTAPAQVPKAAEPVASAPVAAPRAPEPVPAQAAARPAKAQKAPKAAPPPVPAAPAGSEDEALFNRVLMKVARILSVEELPNSEKLYKLKVDIGGGETRQVCAGLRQFLAPEQLREALVCVVANLKPAKLAGEASEAMILAAEAEKEGGLVVRTLIPPAGAAPGDVIFLEGSSPSSTPDKVLKSDHWKKIGGGLAAKGAVAAFNGRPLLTPSGAVGVAPEIPDGAAIH